MCSNIPVYKFFGNTKVNENIVSKNVKKKNAQFFFSYLYQLSVLEECLLSGAKVYVIRLPWYDLILNTSNFWI